MNGEVRTCEGTSVDREFRLGAQRALDMCEQAGGSEEIAACILQDRSPSCGAGRVYDGTFSGTLTAGNGVFVDMLLRHGYRVIPASEFDPVIKDVDRVDRRRTQAVPPRSPRAGTRTRPSRLLRPSRSCSHQCSQSSPPRAAARTTRRWRASSACSRRSSGTAGTGRNGPRPLHRGARGGWIGRYNTERRSDALGGRTPAEFRSALGRAA